jgi:hypothetical protein
LRINKSSIKAIFEVKYSRVRGGDQQSEVFEESLNADALSAIAKELDFRVINAMNEVYGCPDCADGGSEWIEIRNEEGTEHTKRVTFEYGKAPKEIEKLVNLLRPLKEELSAKYVPIQR